MLENISYYMIGPLPLIAYGGIITFLLMLFTAMIPFLMKKGVSWAKYNLHRNLAIVVIILAIIHGILGLFAFL